MKRFLVFLLTLAAIFSLAACAKPDEATVMSEYKALYERSLQINEIIFGKGLPYEGNYDGIEAETHYVAVSESSPYKSVAELEAAVLSVYTKAYYESSLKTVLFVGFEDEYAKTNIRYKEVDGVLYVNVKHEGFELSGRCATDSAYVEKLSRASARIAAPYFYGNGTQMAKDKVITMVMTDAGWRFDNPSY